MRPMKRLVSAMVVAALLAPAASASAGDYFGQDAPSHEISYRVDNPRTTRQRIVLGALFGGAALASGIGLAFHLDSRSKSNDVTETGELSGRTYDPAVDATRRGALRSRTRAIVAYGIGGALAAAGVVALILTDPGSHEVKVGKKKQESVPPPTVPVSLLDVQPVLLRGGAGVQLRGTWSF